MTAPTLRLTKGHILNANARDEKEYVQKGCQNNTRMEFSTTYTRI